MVVDAPRIAVAGASGNLGNALVDRLLARGFAVRALTRRARVPNAWKLAGVEVVRADARHDDLTHALSGCDAVISCLGASLSLSPFAGWRSFRAVDTHCNLRLIEAAERQGIARFVYVSVAGGPSLRDLAYVDAHERVVDALAQTSMRTTVVRPTGFHDALAVLVSVSRVGVLPVLADGAATTNPIDVRDLAEIIVRDLASQDDGAEPDASPPDAGKRARREIAAGGPDLLSRRRIAELAFLARGRKPRLFAMPPALMRFAARLLAPILPRLGALLTFYAAVMTCSCCAPARGTRPLHEAFADKASGGDRLSLDVS